MAIGGRGVISVVSNEMPAEMVQMVEAAERGDFATARAIHNRLMPLMQVNFVEANPDSGQDGDGGDGAARGESSACRCAAPAARNPGRRSRRVLKRSRCWRRRLPSRSRQWIRPALPGGRSDRAARAVSSTSTPPPVAKPRLGRWLAGLSRAAAVSPSLEQPVDEERFNMLASYVEPPPVVFSTHFDCVPPFFPSRVETGDVSTAADRATRKGFSPRRSPRSERLAAGRRNRVGLLFVVGEERGSDGARVANDAADGLPFPG